MAWHPVLRAVGGWGSLLGRELDCFEVSGTQVPRGSSLGCSLREHKILVVVVERVYAFLDSRDLP
jgi:hypothetical protein